MKSVFDAYEYANSPCLAEVGLPVVKDLLIKILVLLIAIYMPYDLLLFLYLLKGSCIHSFSNRNDGVSDS